MNPLILIPLIVLGAVAALCLAFAAIAWISKCLGHERIERYAKMRVQGPFVPTPEDRTDSKT